MCYTSVPCTTRAHKLLFFFGLLVCVFQLKMPMYTAQCCAGDEKCFSSVDLRVEVFESQKFKFRLFLSGTGFGRVQRVTEGMGGWLASPFPAGMGLMHERLGRKLEDMGLVVETPFIQLHLVKPLPFYCSFSLLPWVCPLYLDHKCLRARTIQQ